MYRKAGCYIAAVLFLMSAQAVPQARRSTIVAFLHVTVIDGTGTSARPDQTVLVSADRITAVGPSSNVRIP